jgi:exodeoxyribonuclease V alpha subunit
VLNVKRPDDILSDIQLEAFDNAMNCRISILTGGAGTGKTRTIVEIVRALTKAGKRVQLTSKTGKAVARMSEMMDGINVDVTYLCDPRTLDKLIRTTETFDYLIIDEASMLNTETFSKFMSSRFSSELFPILFVGDNNQLEQIGVGNIFFELYLSNCVATTKLEQNFRIHGDGALMRNVMSIVSNNPTIEEGDDFVLVPSLDEEQSMDHVTELVIRLKDLGVKAENLHILSPYNDPLEVLNQICIYAYFNELPTAHKPFVVGQRVAMKHNNYQNDLFHGAVGIVTECTSLEVSVRFKHLVYGDVIKVFTRPEYDTQTLPDNSPNMLWSIIAHAHATSVHASQGSEYHSVILYLQYREKVCKKFLTYRLLYTALSRAQDAMYCIGDIDLLTSCNEQASNDRVDTLCNRLRTRFDISTQAENIIADALGGCDDDMFEGDFY